MITNAESFNILTNITFTQKSSTMNFNLKSFRMSIRAAPCNEMLLTSEH